MDGSPTNRRTVTPLRLAVAASGQRQKDVAERAGISETHFSRLVNGLHADQATRQKISAALGREISELWPDHMEQAA